VSLDKPAYLPDDYIPSQDAKLDIYRRLSACRTAESIDDLRQEVRDRFGALPEAASALFATTLLRILGAAVGIEGVLVRGQEARVSFRADAVPRLKGLSAAFHDVQFSLEVRRERPLAIKLVRLGGAEILDGLARALRALTV
jgi:transcription-repair coupling factor (superfamily II helicase)